MRRTLISVVGLIAGTVLLVAIKSTAFGTPAGYVADAPVNPAVPGGSSGPGAAAGPAGPGKSLGQGTTPGRTPAAGTKPGQPPAPGTTPQPGQTTTAPSGPGAPTATKTTPSQTGTTTTTAAPPPTTVTVTGAYVAVPTAESPTSKSSSCGDCHNYSISVTLTISGGRITKATTSYNTSPAGSQRYADQATNQLQPAILSSQTWNLGRVSGATYAGNAWEQSARDAMSKAGLPV
jgi:uncharacterized protein with FMN-binding domain